MKKEQLLVFWMTGSDGVERAVVEFRPDGSVFVPPHFTATEAAREFWKILESVRPASWRSSSDKASYATELQALCTWLAQTERVIDSTSTAAQIRERFHAVAKRCDVLVDNLLSEDQFVAGTAASIDPRKMVGHIAKHLSEWNLPLEMLTDLLIAAQFATSNIGANISDDRRKQFDIDLRFALRRMMEGNQF